MAEAGAGAAPSGKVIVAVRVRDLLPGEEIRCGTSCVTVRAAAATRGG